ncbi:MAG: hypothetical protein JJU36_10965 [Phycisphaeraceae bacterium]|nr:hypothetical protein [Phycisphaeraceae bacterium]
MARYTLRFSTVWAFVLISAFLFFALGWAETVRADSGDERGRAQAMFDSLYGADIQRARSTRDSRESVDLAQRLLVNARISGVNAPLAELMLDAAHDLAMRQPAGFDIAVQAMRELAERVPERHQDAYTRAISASRRAMSAASADNRPAEARRLVELHLELATALEDSGQYAEAGRILSQATGPANTAGRRWLEDIRAAQRRVSDLTRVQRDVENLRARLESSPTDQTIRSRLVTMLAVDLQNPREAARIMHPLTDEDLKNRVRMAIQPIGRLNAEQSLEMANWYHGLAGSRSGDLAVRLMVQSAEAFRRYLAVSSGDTPQRAHATLMLRRLESDIRRMAADGVASASAAAASRRVNMLSHVRSPTGRDHHWTAERGEISANVPDAVGWHHGPRFTVETGFSYSVTMKLQVQSVPRGRHSVRISFPVDETLLMLTLMPNHGDAQDARPAMSRARPPLLTGFELAPGPMRGPTDFDLRIEVRQIGSEVDIQITLNEEEAIKWRGSVRELSPPDPNTIGHPQLFRVQFPSPFVGRIMEFTGSGEIQPLSSS